ncbi:MAG: MATE family efflux transporter [Spirochaetes bacterium]|uniref:MATE family efflux transporter n=1 Tax=Candidatus Ornithospirochaeta stercoripullorum TaxID=2840899 RepID=A0A9D9DY61_9SPIO|nr:MATE family efflux transporter [Candidatus Ornithospirochaeta stercoripullorum]
MKALDLSEGPIASTLFRFAIPFLLANILQSLYGAVDLFVVGRFCQAASVAAVSTGTQVTQIVTSLMTGLTLGSTIIIGGFMGEKDYEKVKKTIGTTLTVFTIFSIIITISMLIFNKQILMLLNTPQESFKETMTYVTICTLGNIFICLYNAISAILRGYGDSTRPMIFVGIACVLNIVLDFLFTGAMSMGVSGVALATVISQAISMLIAIIYLKRMHFIFDFRLRSFKPDGEITKQLGRVGIPISFQELAVRISFLYLTMMMNSAGVYGAAVVGVGAKYDVFAMLSATSMANALAAITAQNLGRGKPKRARTSLWIALSFALGVSFLFWLWAQLSPETMIGLFTSDSGVIKAGIPYFRSASYDYIATALVFTLNGYLNGRQKTLWTMVSCTFGALVLRIPMVWIFGNRFGSDLGLLGTIAPTVSGIMAFYTLIYILRDGRKQKALKA